MSNPIIKTRHWLESFIISCQICPFAERVYKQQQIHFQIDTETDIEKLLFNLILECQRLDNTADIATTLIIYPQALSQFEDYLDYLALAEALLTEQGYEGTYQLASFHPDYCFEGVSPDDASNYTNRSPYPMLHLLRESDIEQAIAHYPDPENIPERNIQLTRQLGIEKLCQLLSAC